MLFLFMNETDFAGHVSRTCSEIVVSKKAACLSTLGEPLTSRTF